MATADYSKIYNLTEEQVSLVVAHILADMGDETLQDAIDILIDEGEDNGASENVGVLPTDDKRKLIALYYGECIDEEALKVKQCR